MDPSLLELDLDKPAAPAKYGPTPIATAPDLDLVDNPKTPTCLGCGATVPVNDGGLCEGCYLDANPVPTAPAVEPEVAPVAADFADIAANAAANANDARGRANLGVGFHNDTGYIEALKRGVARATLSEYCETLRTTYKHDVKFTIEGSAYTVTLNGTSFTAPILEVVSGNGGYGEESHVNDAAIEAFKANVRAKKAKAAGLVIAPVAEADAPRVRFLKHGDLVAGAAADGNGILTHWTGAGAETLATLGEYCDAAEVPAKYRPKAKKPETQANLAVNEVGIELGLTVRREKKKDLVHGDAAYDRRWFLSEPNHAAGAGESAGTVVLVVTLDGDTLKFDVQTEAAEKIAARFLDLCGREVLQAGHITSWLGGYIRDCLGGVRYGGSWYVPRETRGKAEKLISTFAPKWGSEWMNPPLPIATSAQLAAGIAAGLKAEVDATLTELDSAAAATKEKKVGEKAAVNYLSKFRAHGERVLAYGQLLGEDLVADCKKKVADAVAKLEGSLDGATIRYALAMEEAEADYARAASAEESEDADA